MVGSFLSIKLRFSTWAREPCWEYARNDDTDESDFSLVDMVTLKDESKRVKKLTMYYLRSRFTDFIFLLLFQYY